MDDSSFTARRGKRDFLLAKAERAIVKVLVDKIPQWIQTYHLTLLTLLWSFFVLVFSLLARKSLQWLWLVSLMILFQYATDLFDGAVGRHRSTGLIRWGYYMDHFLDYLFLCSLIVGYSFLLPDDQVLFLVFLVLAGALMMHSHLAFAAEGAFVIAHFRIGPSELRVCAILTNTFVIFLGLSFLAKFLTVLLPVVLFFLVVIVYRAQRRMWSHDMADKARRKKG